MSDKSKYIKECRDADMDFLRKKRDALLIQLNKEGARSESIRWYWIGRHLQQIQCTINESFWRGVITEYQYHILYKWMNALDRYIDDIMVEEIKNG